MNNVNGVNIFIGQEHTEKINGFLIRLKIQNCENKQQKQNDLIFSRKFPASKKKVCH